MIPTKNIITRVTALSVSIGAVTLLAGCGQSSDAGGNGDGNAGPTEVTLGTGNWVGYGPWHIAEDQGYFDENDITVEQTVFGASDRLAAFASGELDAANFAVHSAYLLQQQGVEFQLVALLDYSLEADGVLAGPGIDGPADLEGLNVAYEPSSASEIMMSATLEAGGLTLDDVNAVPLSAADAASAVVAEQVDAAVTYEPYISPTIAENPELSTVFTGAESPGIVSDVLLVRDDFIEENPEAVEGLLSAWGASIDFFESDEEEGRAVIAEGVGASSPEELETAFVGVEFFGTQEGLHELTDGEYRNDVMPMMVERAADADIIEEPDVDLEELVDTSFLENVAE